MGVCDPDLFAYKASCKDLATAFGDVLGGVCLTCGERATGTRVSIAQVDDIIGDGDHQDVL